MRDKRSCPHSVRLPDDGAIRKMLPMARGLLDYFPLALAYVSFVSYMGNLKHNPGESLHWSRDKSDDHADTVIRHMCERGMIDEEGVRHTGHAAWRILAELEKELEGIDLEDEVRTVIAMSENDVPF